ncbi:hypothetical protein EV356DRAFT_531139 [Viridothelium virens]|uniref:Fungal N-terminal domain-containing protein n=1 Tax=Viridothelium virens TaxID=1048519 RepID=A0A6A6HDY6_VIRVR|nr:hypothetical protein EV356DRAFT_531139 [Viridothelium virens]
MVVPFGISVGDFIAFIETTIKVVNALQDSKGARKEYEGISRELVSLKHALTGIQDVKTDDPQTEKSGVGASTYRFRATTTTASDPVICQFVVIVMRQLVVIVMRQFVVLAQTIQDFLDKTQKYDLSLGSATHSRPKWKDGLRKIQWTLYSKEDVQKFRWQLYSHTASLILLLGQVIHVAAAADQQEQRSALIRLETKTDAERRQATAMQASIMSTILHCWKEFQLMVALILSTNFRIFDLIASCSKIPSQLSFEQPVSFQDAHGRMLPIQVAWIDTWDHFETMLKWKFSTLPGLAKIERGEYVLTDPFGTKDIDRARSIQSVFRPGRRINMSMIFRQSLRSQNCPKCDNEVLESSDLDNHCEACGLWYSRLRDSLLAGGNKNSVVSDFEYLFVEEPILHGPLPKRKTSADIDVISDFSRVRILELEDQGQERYEDTVAEASTNIHKNCGKNTNNQEDDDHGVTAEPEAKSIQHEMQEDANMEETVRARSRAASRPNYDIIHRDDLLEDTLLHYNVPYQIDPIHPDYINILRESTVYDKDVLFAHTKRLQEARRRDPGLISPLLLSEGSDTEPSQATNASKARQGSRRTMSPSGLLKDIPLGNDTPTQSEPSKSKLQAKEAEVVPPPNAKWTKIDKRLVDPECLDEANERFEERLDCVTVLRVLTREEIQRYADRTKEIRDRRYDEENGDDSLNAFFLKDRKSGGRRYRSRSQ